MRFHSVAISLILLLAHAESASASRAAVADARKEAFQPGIPVRVGPQDHSSTFSYYNTTPESPDGTRIVYVKFLTTPQKLRSEELTGELWVCSTDLTNHRRITDLSGFDAHNGVDAQWVDNNTIAYLDDSVRVVTTEGKHLTPPIPASGIGHSPHRGKLLYSVVSKKTGYRTVFEYDVSQKQHSEIVDASAFKDIFRLYPSANFKDMKQWKIAHLQYSPDGTKILMVLELGPRDNRVPPLHIEYYRYLVTMNLSGDGIRYFGPKPMHKAWYDNASVMGHDNIVDDGLSNDKSIRRWSLDGKVIETLAGPGNHLASSPDREYFASESWYYEMPVVLNIYKKGERKPIWKDIVSRDVVTTWDLTNHTNPSFSRDGKRVYFNKCVAPGKVQAWMVVVPKPKGN